MIPKIDWGEFSRFLKEKKLIISALVILFIIGVYFVIKVPALSTSNSTPKSSRSSNTAPHKAAGTVELLNGSGLKYLTEDVSDTLRKNGLDVVSTKNYSVPKKQSETIVVVRNNNLACGYYIARLLSLDSTNVVTITNKESLVDISVIIGKDLDINKTKGI